MNALRKKTALLIACLTLSFGNAQYEIQPTAGYTPNIGIMVSMLEDLKARITEQVKDLDQSQTDFLYDEDCEQHWGIGHAFGFYRSLLPNRNLRR